MILRSSACSSISYSNLLNGHLCDALVTDPPYLLLEKRRAPQRSRPTFQPEVTRFHDVASYAVFLDSWLPLALRCIKKEGTVIIFSNPIGSQSIQSCAQREGWRLEGIIPWAKPTRAGGHPQLSTSSETFLRICEHALVFRTSATERTPSLLSQGRLSLFSLKCEVEEDASPPTRRQHPSRKPFSVLEPLLELTPEGGSILDPFSGSGSVAAAAARLGRKPFGLEIDPGWAALAQARLTRCLNEMK